MKETLEKRAAEYTFWLEQSLFLARRLPENGINRELLSFWANSFLQQTGYIIPLGMIWDIAQVFLGQGYYEFPETLPLSEPHKIILHRYQDQVLMRLEQDRKFIALRDALASLPSSVAKKAVSLAIEQLMNRIGFHRETAMSAGYLKKMLQRSLANLEQSAFDTHRDNPTLLHTVFDAYQQLIQRFRVSISLITEADIFVIKHYSILKRLHQRLSIKHILEATEALAKNIPKRLTPLEHQSPQSYVSNLSEELSSYPSGGFSSIANTGTFENLVTSELVYMDTDHQDIDLFDVRFSENELLFYTRDDSHHTRKSQEIIIVLFPDLLRARFKDNHIGWQRLTLIMALIYLCVARISEWLLDDGLSFEIVFVLDQKGKNVLAEELLVLSLLLGQWIAKGTVVIGQSHWNEMVKKIESETKVQRKDLICFSAQRNKRMLPKNILIHYLTLHAGWIDIDIDIAKNKRSPKETDLWKQWCATSELLLRRLL